MRKEELADHLVLRLTKDVENAASDPNFEWCLDRADWREGMLLVAHLRVDGSFGLVSPHHQYMLVESCPGYGELLEACEVAPFSFESVVFEHGVEDSLLRKAVGLLCKRGKLKLEDLEAFLVLAANADFEDPVS